MRLNMAAFLFLFAGIACKGPTAKKGAGTPNPLVDFATSTAEHSAGFPPRDPREPTGSQFLREPRKLGQNERIERAVAQILAGNVPSHIRALKRIRLGTAQVGGKTVEVSAWVLPDYLALGSDKDFIH